jgi:outer membrane lipoprotein-sorting protein
MSRARVSIRALLLSALVAGCGGGQSDAPQAAADSASRTDAAAETTRSAADTAAGGPASIAAAGSDTTARVSGAAADRSAAANSGADTARSGSADERAGESRPGVSEPPPQDIETLLRRTASVYGNIRAMQAQFAMLTENPLLGSRVESRGTLFQRRPDRILLRFTQPAGDIVLADGRYFWIYYPSVDPNQVIRSPATEGAAGGVDLQAQFVGDPVTRFRHTARGREAVNGRDAAVVSLVPHEDLGYRQLDVWIDTQDHLVRKFRITEHNGITRLIELSDVELNPALTDDLFRFVPPAGVRVVERG